MLIRALATPLIYGRAKFLIENRTTISIYGESRSTIHHKLMDALKDKTDYVIPVLHKKDGENLTNR